MRPQDPFIGREILNGQFQILQKVGSGGMGAVYKALQPEMNRMVGVKILHPKLANRKDLVSRFRREARAMSQLTHPNTAKVFLYGEFDDGPLYIIMEFLEGKNLNQTLRADGPFAAERALPILIQASGALEEAHRAGIIHRDLKPENIFLVQTGTLHDFPKLLDFGLAKLGEHQLRPGSVILTQEGMVFGTPEFMSPEQAQGKPLTPASDIYSLAVILYEVLTGKLPFDAKSAMDFIQLHVTGAPIPLNQRVAGRTFPPLLEAVLARALSKRPEDRFPSAAEFAAALTAIQHGAQSLPADLAPRPSPDAQKTQPIAMIAPPSSAVAALAATAPQSPAAVAALAPSPAPARPSPPSMRASVPATLREAALREAPPPVVISPATPGRIPAQIHSVVQPQSVHSNGTRSNRPLPSGRPPARRVESTGVGVGLLVGVAVAFLLLGVGLALTLIRYLR
ncbi:MAG TPA: serine/threonine-protein kinase [Polyangiaceae bacterium]|nr:serine/threonine-protein kinase [Polyangiaceae bacterium]